MAANERGVGAEAPRPAPQPVPALGPDAYHAELRAMMDRAFCFSRAYVDQHMRADRIGADARITEFADKLVHKAFKLGIPLFAHCIIRGSADQNALYRRGVSKARAGESPHNFGCAVDIIHGTKAWDLSAKQWQIVGHLGRELAKSLGLAVTWGGDDPGVDDRFDWDPAHWELSDWRDVRALYSDGEDWDGTPAKGVPPR